MVGREGFDAGSFTDGSQPSVHNRPRPRRRTAGHSQSRNDVEDARKRVDASAGGVVLVSSAAATMTRDPCNPPGLPRCPENLGSRPGTPSHRPQRCDHRRHCRTNASSAACSPLSRLSAHAPTPLRGAAGLDTGSARAPSGQLSDDAAPRPCHDDDLVLFRDGSGWPSRIEEPIGSAVVVCPRRVENLRSAASRYPVAPVVSPRAAGTAHTLRLRRAGL